MFIKIKSDFKVMHYFDEPKIINAFVGSQEQILCSQEEEVRLPVNYQNYSPTFEGILTLLLLCPRSKSIIYKYIIIHNV